LGLAVGVGVRADVIDVDPTVAVLVAPLVAKAGQHEAGSGDQVAAVAIAGDQLDVGRAARQRRGPTGAEADVGLEYLPAVRHGARDVAGAVRDMASGAEIGGLVHRGRAERSSSEAGLPSLFSKRRSAL